MKIALAIINGLTLCVWIASAAPSAPNDQLMTFHPITEAQYDAIVALSQSTTVGNSQGRLIASGIAALRGIASSLRSGLSANWLPNIFSNFVGTQRNATRNVSEIPANYPLCVVKQNEHHPPPSDSYENDATISDDDDDNNDDDDDDTGRSQSHRQQYEKLNGLSIVKCIVVVNPNLRDAYAHRIRTIKTTRTTTTTTTTKPPPPPPPPPTPSASLYAQYPNEPYSYSYPPWYNSLYNYPSSYQNEENYYQQLDPNLRMYSNDFDSPKQEDYHQYYQKARRSQSHRKKFHKTMKKSNRRRHPRPIDFNHYRLHSRIRRSTTQLERGYQPAPFPKINYQSQYPKVSYSSTFNYSSPVYVRNILAPPTEETQQSMEAAFKK